MSNIKSAFKEKAFIGFLTAGDPSIEKSEQFIIKMIEAGADLIEIGIPFSDPIAEGPVIQAANVRALSAGTKLKDIFELVVKIRKKYDTPIVFLTYLNPVFKYGADRFFRFHNTQFVMFLVSINYDDNKGHSCVIEKVVNR